MRRTFLAFVLLALAWSSRARAEVTKPFPGVTLVTRPGSALVIANLCSPGVSVRATKYNERARTPESWANLVGAEVAINADFFDFPAATLTDGRARGAGEDWPAGKQNIGLETRGEDRHYWQFGKVLGADPIEPTSFPPASAAAASEIIGGHNPLIRDGKNLAPNFDGDGILQSAARRTAIGTNKDRSVLYLFTTGNASTGTQLASALLSHAQEGGAPNIDFASNLDGGGSTQMFVKGRGQIVTSGRLVANHLGVMAKGSGAAPMCPGKRPLGSLDAVDCDKVAGWAHDPDEPKKSIDVTLAYDGFVFDPKARFFDTHAGFERPDLMMPVGSTNHGFVAFAPFALFDGKEHPVFALAKDSAGGRGTLLAGSPKKFSCTAVPPPSEKRHIADPSVLAAWKLDLFMDQLALPPATVNAIAEGSKISGPPVLATVAGGSGFYVIDGGARRRIVDDVSLQAWRFDRAKAVPKTKAELLALTSGPPMRIRPMLAKGDGNPLYLLDAPPTETDPGDPLLSPAGADKESEGTGPGGASSTEDDAGGCEAAHGSRSSWPFVLLVLLATMSLCRHRAYRAEQGR